MPRSKEGKVYLVGAGPGDPELLTRKAHRLLQEAKLVLHDDLVPEEILAQAGARAQLVNVGKRCGAKRITQAEIHERMIAASRAGVDVVRLKSGDPAVFGRLGEELDALSAAGVPFEIVPGITAGIAAAAALGLSLTDRRTASRLVIASAHHAADAGDDAPREKEDWSGVARGDTTLLIYMPGHGLAGLREDLLAAGLAQDTPAVLVSHASTKRQRHLHTTLAEIAAVPPLAAPAVLLVGQALARARRKGEAADVSLLLDQAEAFLTER